ncbi:hypothetical protein GE09DRAFT_136097 [Coniochaeta sp. 2T2.1]|nr:hypothetical protein GE09DRAFT_136097 [Coniochaeta sp. 2T2.1]
MLMLMLMLMLLGAPRKSIGLVIENLDRTTYDLTRFEARSTVMARSSTVKSPCPRHNCSDSCVSRHAAAVQPCRRHTRCRRRLSNMYHGELTAARIAADRTCQAIEPIRAREWAANRRIRGCDSFIKDLPGSS